MAKVHIVNLVEIRHWIVPDDSERDEGRWVTQHRFQNANVDRNIIFENHEWSFLSFIYNGATRTRTGDNIEATLLVPSNQIAMDHAYDIVMLDYNEKQHHIKRQVKVMTCLTDNDFVSVKKILSVEHWIGASMGYNEEAVEILLASAIDAVFAGLPNMYLDEKTVGRLPTTSRISTS